MQADSAKLEVLERELLQSRDQAAKQSEVQKDLLSERDSLERGRAQLEKERDGIQQKLHACEIGLKQQLVLVQDERDKLIAREAELIQKHHEDLAAAGANKVAQRIHKFVQPIPLRT